MSKVYIQNKNITVGGFDSPPTLYLTTREIIVTVVSILKKLLKRGECKAMRIITRTSIDYCGTLGNAKE